MVYFGFGVENSSGGTTRRSSGSATSSPVWSWARRSRLAPVRRAAARDRGHDRARRVQGWGRAAAATRWPEGGLDYLFWPDVLVSHRATSSSPFEVVGNIDVAVAVTGLCLLLTTWRRSTSPCGARPHRTDVAHDLQRADRRHRAAGTHGRLVPAEQPAARPARSRRSCSRACGSPARPGSPGATPQGRLRRGANHAPSSAPSNRQGPRGSRDHRTRKNEAVAALIRAFRDDDWSRPLEPWEAPPN